MFVKIVTFVVDKGNKNFLQTLMLLIQKLFGGRSQPKLESKQEFNIVLYGQKVSNNCTMITQAQYLFAPNDFGVL